MYFTAKETKEKTKKLEFQKFTKCGFYLKFVLLAFAQLFPE